MLAGGVQGPGNRPPTGPAKRNQTGVRSSRMIARAGTGRSTQRKPNSANNCSRPTNASALRASELDSGQASIATAPCRRASATAASTKRMTHALTAMLGVDEQAGQQPHGVVLGARATSQHWMTRGISAQIARSRPARTPTDRRTADESHHPHRSVSAGHRLETTPIAPAEPSGRELGSTGAEGHAPAVTGRPLGGEQPFQRTDLVQPHGAHVRAGVHPTNATVAYADIDR